MHKKEYFEILCKKYGLKDKELTLEDMEDLCLHAYYEGFSTCHNCCMKEQFGSLWTRK